MTVTIGALYDDGNGVLFLSDRRITVPFHGLIFEDRIKKKDIDSHSLILTSGMATNLIFLQDVENELKKQATIKSKAEILALSYLNFRAYKFTQEHLGLHGIVNFNDFHNKQKYLNEMLVANLIEQEKIYNIGVELILGGIDENSGHLYHINHPGTHYNYDIIGFCSAPILITSGRVGAIFELCGYTPHDSLSKVLSIAFIAKKRTEILGGIGEETDIWTITKQDGIQKISDATTKRLEDKYNETRGKLSNMFKEIAIEEKTVTYKKSSTESNPQKGF